MFCLAVTMLLRRADKSALVFSTIVYKGVKVKAVAGPTEYRLVGSRWKLGIKRIVCLSNRMVPGFFCLDTFVFSGLGFISKGRS